MSQTSVTDLLVHSREPFNAEPPLQRLRASFVTAPADFYVRCHGPVPDLDANAHRLTVEGSVAERLDLSLADLASRFETVEVTATLQCAGNRRVDLDAVQSVTGDPWSAGAIGTGVWTGVRLLDILLEAGIEEDTALHIAFEGADIIDTEDGRAPYGVSIPIEKALGEEVVVATQLAGKPLAPIHGAPLRLVVPGYAGVRSVKWLRRIIVQATPSDNFHQQKDYRLFPPQMSQATADHAAAVTIHEMPLNSAICEPTSGMTVPSGPTRIAGWAIAGERRVARVDVSSDGGRNFVQATMEDRDSSPFTWTFWHAEMTLAPGEHELVVRAVDSAGQSQPERPSDLWNFKGYLSAAWHRVKVSVAG